MKKNLLARKATALTMAAMLTLLGAQAAFAESLTPANQGSYDPIIAEGSIVKSFEVKGTVEYQDIEGGYYTVDGWRLIGDQDLIGRYVGQTVYVEGHEFDGVSIYMTQALVVSAFTSISETGERGEKQLVTSPDAPVYKSFEVKGTVEWIDLETGYYAVDGWRLIGDQKTIERYAGQYVYVEGHEFDGMSIYMNQGLVLSAITPISEAGERGEKEIILNSEDLRPAPAPDLSLTGTLEYHDLEGGLYMVNGHGVRGLDEEMLKGLLGTTVTVDGVLFYGPSIYNNTLIEADAIKVGVATTMPVPSRIVIDGTAVDFDQQPVQVDGALMVPLRFVVEAAGGTVTWLPEEQAVSVRLGDRTATFVIGQDQAEMNQDGHYYLMRNMLKMEKAPVIMNGRTLISADALDTVLGLFKSVSAKSDSDLTLVK